MTRRVLDVMSRDVVMVSVDSSLVAAARQMLEYDLGDMFVMEDGRLFGVLTDRDIRYGRSRAACRLCWSGRVTFAGGS
ncbi:CBS domain-containing protein [Nonomuraea sp. NBC_00507]|uniref:CBS domain-containing protein n=1 Tax=Nonomuraea sp. NBC_00507 TaxID=2976002 RepID=UPI002E178B2C